MKLRPILFSTPMVQALIAGTKTQTRRIIEKGDLLNSADVKLAGLTNGKKSDHVLANFKWKDQLTFFAGREAKYAIGDVLWVKETFFRGYPYVDDKPTDQLSFWYFADTCDARPSDVSDEWCINEFGSENKEMWPRWKSSLFMPFDAARIFLEVTDIRVERLQDISIEDAIAEGIEGEHTVRGFRDYLAPKSQPWPFTMNAYNSYASLWESINGKDSWQDNPFVWVYNFKQVEKPRFPEMEKVAQK